MAIDMNKLARLRAGKATPSAPQVNQVMELKLQDVIPDPQQPRKSFSDAELQELADSIREQGLIQPITVRETKDGYLIVSGERRYRASLLNQAETIRALVTLESDVEKIAYIQMVENLQREDLNPAEVADFIASRLAKGEKQVEIAKKLGLAKSKISQFSAWQSMPEVIQEAVRDGKITSIETAYQLYKSWEKQPEEVESFIKDATNITRSDARALEKSFAGETFSDDSADENADFTDKISDQPSYDFDDSMDNDDADDFEEEDEKDTFSLDTYSEDEIAAEPEEFKKPIILVTVDDREGELLFKRKAKDGFVIVRFENGDEEVVYAQQVQIDRVIEA